MYFSLLSATNATEAFEMAYNAVNRVGEVVETRLGKAKHLTDVTIEVENPCNNVCVNPQRNLSLKYLLGEIQWYFSGSNMVKDIAQYAKMWNSLTDDGETVNSAYGYRIFKQFGFDQLQYCIEKLKKDKQDRQAIIHIKDASNKPTKDTPCTCLIQFTVYGGHLNAHVYMRSNDIWLGLPYDMAFFMTLQQVVSRETGIPMGRYSHTVGDLHLYEKHWSRGVKYTSVPYEYAWDYTMENKESIQKMMDGEIPDNLLLKTLWRLNNNNAEKD